MAVSVHGTARPQRQVRTGQLARNTSRAARAEASSSVVVGWKAAGQGKPTDVVDAAHLGRHDQRFQVLPGGSGRRVLRQVQVLGLGIEREHPPGRLPADASPALLYASLAVRLGGDAAPGELGIPLGLGDHPAVHDEPHALDRQGRLGEVGGDDDLPRVALAPLGQGPALPVRGQRRDEREDVVAVGLAEGALDLLARRLDRPPGGQEAEDVAEDPLLVEALGQVDDELGQLTGHPLTPLFGQDVTVVAQAGQLRRGVPDVLYPPGVGVVRDVVGTQGRRVPVGPVLPDEHVLVTRLLAGQRQRRVGPPVVDVLLAVFGRVEGRKERHTVPEGLLGWHVHHFGHVGAAEVLLVEVGVEGRGRDDDPQVWILGQLLLQVAHDEVDVGAAFVGLVDDDGADPAQPPLPQPVDHRPVGDVDQLARLVVVAVTRYLVADGVARADATRAGHGPADEGRDANRRLHARLGDDDRAEVGEPGERRRRAEVLAATPVAGPSAGRARTSTCRSRSRPSG